MIETLYLKCLITFDTCLLSLISCIFCEKHSASENIFLFSLIQLVSHKPWLWIKSSEWSIYVWIGSSLLPSRWKRGTPLKELKSALLTVNLTRHRHKELKQNININYEWFSKTTSLLTKPFTFLAAMTPPMYWRGRKLVKPRITYVTSQEHKFLMRYFT